MNISERRRYIAERITSVGEIEFASLADEFGVSEMTIRRDIEVLEEQGLLRRVVGGAISIHGTAQEPSFHARASVATKAKERIARAIVDLLVPGETVLLDSGSTVLSVAREISRGELPVTVVTPSTLVGIELSGAPATTVYLLGGELRPEELSVIGPDTVAAVGRFNCDTFVMGVAGVDMVGGISDYHFDEAHVKEAGMRAASRVIVAADQSKLGRATFAKICPLADVTILVTDAPDDHATVLEAIRQGVRVVTTANMLNMTAGTVERP